MAPCPANHCYDDMCSEVYPALRLSDNMRVNMQRPAVLLLLPSSACSPRVALVLIFRLLQR